MAYGDTVNLKPQQEGAAPVVYKTAARQSIQPLVVAATWDGTGAAGDFVPAVGMYAQNGQRLGVAVLGSTVTAGDTATVSFFPGSQAASAVSGSLDTTDGSTSVNPTSELFIGSGLTLTNPAPGEAEIVAVPYAPPTAWEVIVTSGAAGGSSTLSFAHSSGSTLFDFTTPSLPTANAAGIYAIFGSIKNTGTMANGQYLEVEVDWAPQSGTPVVSTASILRTSAGLTVPLSSIAAVGYFALNDHFSGAWTTPSATASFSGTFYVQRVT